MANQLKMAPIHAIIGLLEQGWRYRRIARELGVRRETVARHDRLRGLTDSKPSNSTPGSGPEGDSRLSHMALGSCLQEDSKPANATAGSGFLPLPDCSVGPPSLCQPLSAVIEARLDQGLWGQRIWQDLVSEHGFSGSYGSVKRFIRRLGRKKTPLPFRRMECPPGAEAQVDFSSGNGLSRVTTNVAPMSSLLS
jgi:hypothetical protein